MIKLINCICKVQTPAHKQQKIVFLAWNGRFWSKTKDFSKNIGKYLPWVHLLWHLVSAALASDSHGQCQFDQTHKLHLQSLQSTRKLLFDLDVCSCQSLFSLSWGNWRFSDSFLLIFISRKTVKHCKIWIKSEEVGQSECSHASFDLFEVCRKNFIIGCYANPTSKFLCRFSIAWLHLRGQESFKITYFTFFVLTTLMHVVWCGIILCMYVLTVPTIVWSSSAGLLILYHIILG